MGYRAKTQRSYVGYCGVYSHLGTNGPIPGEGTLAFYLAQAYWGQGFATEAGTMFVRFAFQELLLRRLVATVQTGNSASLRVLEKLGFSWHHFEPGEARSFNHFELLAT
jgi:[ribosomal protein S5]-alanine N-acetyltransferase